MNVDDMIRTAAAQLQQKWFDPATARSAVNGAQNDLSPAAQAYELRVKLLEDRCDAMERLLRKHGFMK